MKNNYQKEVQMKLTKNLLDTIILQYLRSQPMHGYQLLARIRKDYGVYFGPSTIYPLLGALEKKGHLKSTWNMDDERPKKTYSLTNEGQAILDFTENSLTLICKSITKENRNIQMNVAVGISANTQKPNIHMGFVAK